MGHWNLVSPVGNRRLDFALLGDLFLQGLLNGSSGTCRCAVRHAECSTQTQTSTLMDTVLNAQPIHHILTSDRLLMCGTQKTIRQWATRYNVQHPQVMRKGHRESSVPQLKQHREIHESLANEA